MTGSDNDEDGFAADGLPVLACDPEYFLNSPWGL